MPFGGGGCGGNPELLPATEEHMVDPIDNYQTPVNISDLSSWESSKDEDLLPDVSNQPNNNHPMQSKLKHSQGMLNLSKFLDSDDDEEVIVKPPDAIENKEEKIYDSVENIPDHSKS